MHTPVRVPAYVRCPTKNLLRNIHRRWSRNRLSRASEQSYQSEKSSSYSKSSSSASCFSIIYLFPALMSCTSLWSKDRIKCSYKKAAFPFGNLTFNSLNIWPNSTSDLLDSLHSSPFLHYFLIDDISATVISLPSLLFSPNFTTSASRAPTRSS